MDEKVTVNLVFFLLPSPLALLTTFPSPARTIPSPLALLVMLPSPALIIPFPLLNKLSNKLAPNVPSNILKNPPFCSLVSFLIVLLTPFNKIPEFSNNFHNIFHVFLFNN